jgi:hypothetical protein
MKKLPIGIQNINEIIKENYVYVDKTKNIYNLFNGKYYFFARPRRFGKSLLISTIGEIFSGNKELFKDQWIYDKIDWNKYPVINIDFSVITHSEGRKDFIDNIKAFLKRMAARFGIELEEVKIKEMFEELVRLLDEKYGKVVILIDEYDKPIIDHIQNTEKNNENKEVLADFYEVIKNVDKHLKFVFITGVSKFSKVSIFSRLNNLIDITIDEEFNDICGYTQEELEKNFSSHIETLIIKEKSTHDETLKKIKKWYNGYNWSGKKTLYNPFGILNLFRTNKFKNYWFQTATPTFLIKLIQENKVQIEEFDGYQAGEAMFESYDIENVDSAILLFQTGYLTVKKIRNRKYVLGYPNFEVKESFLIHLLGNYSKISTSKIGPIYLDMVDYLKDEDINNFKKSLVSIFAGIPSFLHLDHEYYYHSLSYMILALLGAEIRLEENTDKGRIDGVIEFDNIIYIIEFKMGKASDAMTQIEDRQYYEKYLFKNKKIILLAIGGFKDKNVEVLYKTLDKL